MDPLKRLAGLSATKRASSLFEEFKKFAFKGNVVDLAIGVIIGAAFGAIVKSLVDDIIMPLIGLALPPDGPPGPPGRGAEARVRGREVGRFSGRAGGVPADAAGGDGPRIGGLTMKGERRKLVCPSCGHETAYDPRECERFLRFRDRGRGGRQKSAVVFRVRCARCGREPCPRNV
jgi:hypothetical protein